MRVYKNQQIRTRLKLLRFDIVILKFELNIWYPMHAMYLIDFLTLQFWSGIS